MVVHTHGDFIVLFHWETRPSVFLVFHLVTLSWHWANRSFPHPYNAECLARKQLLSILKSLVWVDQGSNPQVSASLIFQNRRRMLYSFEYMLSQTNGLQHLNSSLLRHSMSMGYTPDWVAEWVVSVSHVGRSGNPNLAGSNQDLASSNPVELNDFKIDTCSYLAWRSALLG